jgi:hypothetical protein
MLTKQWQMANAAIEDDRNPRAVRVASPSSGMPD